MRRLRRNLSSSRLETCVVADFPVSKQLSFSVEREKNFVNERSFQSAIFFRKSARLDDLEYKATTTTAKMNAAAACGRRRRHARAFDTHKKNQTVVVVAPFSASGRRRRLDFAREERRSSPIPSRACAACSSRSCVRACVRIQKVPSNSSHRRSLLLSLSRWQRGGVVVPGWSEGRTAASSWYR